MLNFINALPGAVSQGLIWGIMAIGVYITYKLLDIADLSVDGSFCTGAAVFVVLFTTGTNLWLAMLCSLLAGLGVGVVLFLLLLTAGFIVYQGASVANGGAGILCACLCGGAIPGLLGRKPKKKRRR